MGVSNYEEQVAGLVGADMAYVACATVGILVITPGIALFYGGMLRGQNFMTLVIQSYLVTAIITAQWYFFGFSLASSTTSASVIMGNFRNGAMMNLDAGPLAEGLTIPAVESWVFSDFFAVCTIQIFLGAIAERGRLLPSLVLGFVWCTLCYCPFAYWTWDANGWLYTLGALDFAGGGPVHISSGIASLCYSWFLGPRKGWKENGKKLDYKPYSPLMSFIGSLLIYFPWLFFNSGTLTTVTTPRTLYILANTQISASFAMITFVFIEYFKTKKWSISAATEGTVIGLVFVTPACGFLEPWAIVVGSIFTAIVCNLTYESAAWMGIDDTTHSFNVHGIGGIVGAICVGVFASPSIAGMDGVTEIDGGWIFHHWKQMGYQFAAWCSIVGWTAVMTIALCYIIDRIPGLKMRVSEEAEEMGLDIYEMEEMADHFIDRLVEGHSNVQYLDAKSGDNPNANSSSSMDGANYEMNDLKSPVVLGSNAV